MIAAKSIELDSRVPYFSMLQSVMDLEFYSREDLQKAEVKAIKLLNFNFQQPTLLDILHFYTSQGIVFANDEYSRSFSPIMLHTPPTSPDNIQMRSKQAATGYLNSPGEDDKSTQGSNSYLTSPFRISSTTSSPIFTSMAAS